MDYDWLVIKYDVQPNVFLCERCNMTYAFSTPCSFKMLDSMMTAFISDHKKCKVKS